MNKAWMTIPMAAIAMVGCQSEPEPVTQVPPPNYSAEPEPLPPVVISDGSAYSPAGNPPTTNPAPAPQPAQPATRTYTVRKGDTLWAIATREYGNGQKWVDIAQANPSVDPNKLMIGQQIVLP